MKKKREYFPKKASGEYVSVYIWMRFTVIGAFINALLVVMFGPHNKLGLVVLLFLWFLIVIGAFFMIFHLIRYLRNYFRQE
ncbi:hypothetical protein QUF88_17075 [Bacillus sp. DX1.1]|uniref:hypothetical protein n=1 Tax=unclassified Bacillus (in: firmicutes) TaxID=185979 RepID=UPI002570FB53|nr:MULTISPECIES: hypothetical protein [unclassified Bacillus (in: firmicutes)]MDM5155454.1 hypothetical protein [Bacillus sp. DX1.1]WJE79767.1 hypothetical protein QRE67_14600 [Bacillus sp. DX3.1]